VDWIRLVAKKKAHDVNGFLNCLSGTYPIVLIYGPDKGLVSERANIFAKNTGVNVNDPFSTIHLDATDIDHDPARLYDEACTISLFGNHRLIWIRNAGVQKGLTKAVRWLLQKSPEQVFILIEAGDLKKRAILRQLVEQAGNAMALPCYSDDIYGIDQLIDEILSKFDMRIALDARALLRKNLGADRRVSRNELEKLCLYAKGKDIINLEDIAEAISDVSVISQDEITDAVISGNLSTLNNSLERQIEDSTPLFSILSAVQRQFQQLQELRFLMDNAASIVTAPKSQIDFHRQKTVEKALSRWSAKQIAHAMERLHNTMLESRKHAGIASSIVRQNLIDLAAEII